MEPYQKCVVFLLSAEEDSNGYKKLYATISSKLVASGTTYKAVIDGDIFRVYKDAFDGRLKSVKINPLSKQSKDKLGIYNNTIYFNSNKTPLHEETRFINNINNSLKLLGDKLQKTYKLDLK